MLVTMGMDVPGFGWGGAHLKCKDPECNRRVRGRNCHPPKLIRLLPLIAQRPVMARWNRDAYKHQKSIKTYVTERSQAIEGQALFDLFKTHSVLFRPFLGTFSQF